MAALLPSASLSTGSPRTSTCNHVLLILPLPPPLNSFWASMCRPITTRGSKLLFALIHSTQRGARRWSATQSLSHRRRLRTECGILHKRSARPRNVIPIRAGDIDGPWRPLTSRRRQSIPTPHRASNPKLWRRFVARRTVPPHHCLVYRAAWHLDCGFFMAQRPRQLLY